MRRVNVHEAKSHLSRLIGEAARGDPFGIAKAGNAMVEVVPLEPAAVDANRRFGFLQGAVWTVPDDFDTFVKDEVIAMFEGDEF